MLWEGISLKGAKIFWTVEFGELGGLQSPPCCAGISRSMDSKEGTIEKSNWLPRDGEIKEVEGVSPESIELIGGKAEKELSGLGPEMFPSNLFCLETLKVCPN